MQVTFFSRLKLILCSNIFENFSNCNLIRYDAIHLKYVDSDLVKYALVFYILMPTTTNIIVVKCLSTISIHLFLQQEYSRRPK